MAAPTTVAEVVDRLRAMDASLAAGDGVAVFNRMYLTVTERIGALLADAAPTFADLWLEAYDEVAGGRRAPVAWRPLFEARAGTAIRSSTPSPG